MKDKIAHILQLCKTYKWYILPLLIMFGLTGAIIIAYININTSPAISPERSISPTVSPTGNVTQSMPTETPIIESGEPGPEIDEDFETDPTYQGSFQKADGTTVYSFASTNPSRQNIILSKGTDNFIFERNVISPEYPVFIQHFTEQYGQPEHLVTGSIFYGPQAQTYIYAKEGIAFIANPQTNQVLEQHLFSEMSVSEYIQQFGDDIPQNAK